jgi:hypothetical protein
MALTRGIGSALLAEISKSALVSHPAGVSRLAGRRGAGSFGRGGHHLGLGHLAGRGRGGPDRDAG